MKKITLRELLNLQDAGNVLYTEPTTYEVFADDVPVNLLKANAEYVKALKNLDEEIEKARKTI